MHDERVVQAVLDTCEAIFLALDRATALTEDQRRQIIEGVSLTLDAHLTDSGGSPVLTRNGAHVAEKTSLDGRCQG